MKRPLPARPDAGGAPWRSRRLLPAAAAGVLFAGAFGVGMATKSSTSPQTATSLASPVSIQAPRASVPALQRDVPTPALKSRPAPRKPHRTPPASTTPTAAATQGATSTGATPPVAPHVVQTPPAHIIHGHTGVVVQSSGGGGSNVVHGGN